MTAVLQPMRSLVGWRAGRGRTAVGTLELQVGPCIANPQISESHSPAFVHLALEDNSYDSLVK